jgi:hypothetical protein
MALPRKPLSARRLADASDAVLLAVTQASHDKQSPRSEQATAAQGQVAPGDAAAIAPLEKKRAPRRHACLRSFTRAEIEEACKFLVRLGVLEVTPGRTIT